ncbi:ATP-binding Cassette (ABC) superfamily [Achlya hypogyna]|uniref:ATP-binding Cassette (ABC) superfamily n=1 Tax=Achlya hypogyna TaxID=1202772 RepID=A0A1V9Z7J9_ACHHY|nr:ATP-binding Cassette (ABC) superfamily [Achlya hypogyna]
MTDDCKGFEEPQFETDDDEEHDVDDVEAAARLADETVAMLVQIGCRLVCIDFDATFVKVHTNGEWPHTAAELVPHVRAYFRILCPLLTEKTQLTVAVVTFSPQLELIQEVLRLCFEPSVANRIIVRCNDTSWCVLRSEAEKFTGIEAQHLHLDRKSKVSYVVSAGLAACKLQQADPANYFILHQAIKSADTLLIDDCADNVAIASQCGIPGLHFDPTTFRAQLLALDKHEPGRQRRQKLAKMLSRRLQQPIKLQVICSSPPVKARKSPGRPAFCTPSPMTKLKVTSRVGRPKSKRCTKFRILPERVAIKPHDDGASDTSFSLPSVLSWNTIDAE